MDRLDAQATTPFRPLDARFRRAHAIVTNGWLATWRDDRPTVQAAQFMRRLRGCCSARDRHALRSRMPEFYDAFEFHREASAGLRLALEARLLAGEPAESIAAKVGLTPGAVEVCRLLFCDVEKYRTASDVILQQVIGNPETAGSEQERRERIVKLIGYCAGPAALDQILAPACSADGAQSAEEALTAYARAVLRLKSAAAAHVLSPAEKADRRELLKAVGRAADSTVEQSEMTTIERHIAAMLEEIPWTTGREGGLAVPEPLREFDESSVEPRCDELMLLAAGESLSAERMAEIKSLDGLPFAGRSDRRSPAGEGRARSTTTDDCRNATKEDPRNDGTKP